MAGVAVPTAWAQSTSEHTSPLLVDVVDWDKQYRDALGRWVRGDDSALLDLADFSTRHVHAANCIRIVPFSLGLELKQIDLENVVPLILLHEALFLTHLHRAESAEAVIQMELHDQLLELYLDEPADSELAVRLLTVPAAFMLQARDRRSLEQARILLKQAVELDPENVMALRFQAQLHELDGRFGRVAEILERVLELEPQLHSSRLHLALAYLRSGREEAGRRTLEELTRNATDWVGELAYEELVREHMRRGELDTAAEILDEALDRFSESSELWLQSAVLALRNDRQPPTPSEANLARWSERTEPSPRYLFDRGPFELLEPYVASFQDRLAERKDRLRRALSYVEKSGGFRPKIWRILGTRQKMKACMGFLEAPEDPL